VSASHHNGKIGKVVNFDALTARYHVMLGPGTTVALKDGNILPAGGEGTVEDGSFYDSVSCCMLYIFGTGTAATQTMH